MTDIQKKAILKEFQQIPGVGPRIAEDLWRLDFRSVRELAGQDPQAMYYQLCAQQALQVDRCMLYVFRCAVYYASNRQHDPELLKWWNWKDDKLK
jgi:hypothetical protein